MPPADPSSVLPFATPVVLLIILLAGQLGQARSDALPAERMRRLIFAGTGGLIFVACVLAIFYRTIFVTQPSFLGNANEVPGIGWAHAALQTPSLSGVLVGFALVVLAAVAIGAQYVIYRSLSRDVIVKWADSRRAYSSRSELAVRAFSTVVLAPIGEECIYRAVLPAGIFAATNNIAAALIVPLVLFALAHYPQKTRGVMNAAILGAVATLLYVVTENLWLCIALHALGNLLATVVSPELQRRTLRRIADDAIAPFANDSLLGLAPRARGPLR